MLFYGKETIKMKLFNKVEINEKAVWGVVALGASVLGLIAGTKNDKYKQDALTDEAAKRATEMVLEKLSTENN